MSFLLDTHVLLWLLGDEPIDPVVRGQLADRANLVMVSSASVWEISVKAALGRIAFDGSIEDAIDGVGFEPLPITAAHAERAGGLPAHHRDPFDRMLVAQAQIEGLTLVSRDGVFSAYEVALLRC